jgi:hypothetical protein
LRLDISALPVATCCDACRHRAHAQAHRGHQVRQAHQRRRHGVHGGGHLVHPQRLQAGAQVALRHAVHLVVQLHQAAVHDQEEAIQQVSADVAPLNPAVRTKTHSAQLRGHRLSCAFSA